MNEENPKLETEGRIETIVLDEPWDVDHRLSEMNLDRDGLMRVIGIAHNEALNTTPFHCVNAPGTLAYQQGTWALRDEYVNKGWKVDRPNGVEAIFHDELGLRIVFSNVDVCCNAFSPPKPRSAKGAGSERVCNGTLFETLPHYVKPTASSDATYYLMMDENGAAELTRTVVSNGTFSGYIERIYLSQGGDLPNPTKSLDDDDAADDFDPKVARK